MSDLRRNYRERAWVDGWDVCVRADGAILELYPCGCEVITLGGGNQARSGCPRHLPRVVRDSKDARWWSPWPEDAT